MLTGENIPIDENGTGLIFQGIEGSWEEELPHPGTCRHGSERDQGMGSEKLLFLLQKPTGGRGPCRGQSMVFVWCQLCYGPRVLLRKV